MHLCLKNKVGDHGGHSHIDVKVINQLFFTVTAEFSWTQSSKNYSYIYAIDVRGVHGFPGAQSFISDNYELFWVLCSSNRTQVAQCKGH